MSRISLDKLLLQSSVVEEVHSKYNGHLVVKKDLAWGTYIQADGLTQSGGVVGSIWKKPINKIQDSGFRIHDCLILGLGGGTIAKLIRKNWPSANITGVEIDPEMIRLGEKYLGLKELNVEVIIGDVFKLLNHKSKILNQTSHDVIFVDLYCGDKFPKKFEEEKFLKNIKKFLKKDGKAVFNRLYFDKKRSSAVKFGKKLESIFGEVIWIYPEANLMFICSS